MMSINKNKNVNSVLISLLIIILSLVLLPVSTFADTDSSQINDKASIIKIGLYEYPGYAYRDSEGVWRGIDIEYSEKIAQYAGFRVSFVPIKSHTEALEMLKSGEIDAIDDMPPTAENKKNLLFSDVETGSSSCGIITRDDNNSLDYADTSKYGIVVFGCQKNNYSTTKFLKWCERHGITPKIKYYSTLKEEIAALASGKVEAACIGADSYTGYRTVMLFGASDYYLTFSKDNTDLKNKVDTAMNTILTENPNYTKELRVKYLTGKINQNTAFSKDERRYILSHSTVTVAVMKDDAPYYYKENGRQKGIIIDYYKMLSKTTGLDFSYKEYDTQREVIDAVNSGDADIVSLYSSGLISANMDGLSVTKEYTSVNTVLISKAGTDTEDIGAIAIKNRSSSAVMSQIPSEYSDVVLKKYDTANQCFEALKAGKVDAVIIGLPSATWLINQSYTSEYLITSLPAVTLELSGAVSYDNTMLRSIMNKAIYANGNSFESIVTSDTMPGSSWRTLIASIPPVVILSFALGMILIILMLLMAMFSLRRRQKEKTAVERQKLENERQKIEIEAAQRNAETKNQFFSNISHDMRTPLNAIIGFSELAENEDTSPDVRDYLDKIRSSGRLLQDMINDTLVISRIGNGKLIMNPEPVKLHELFDSVVSPVRLTAEKRNITFTADDAGCEDKVILADQLNLEKIILNLLTNAVKYTNEGGKVDFTVRAEDVCSDDAKSLNTVFTVKDNGIGISEDFIPHMFEPFAQENQSGFESSGTGLGLAIVKQIVDLMGGTIDVESSKGSGTMFTVRLCFPKIESDQETSEAAADKNLAILNGKKILVCEDNSLNSEIVSALLCSKGMAVEVAADGQQGVDAFAASQIGEFAAILMDIRMPVLNGFEAARKIRALDRSDALSVPIIAVTANAFDEDKQESVDAGMNEHISKPIEPDKMFDVLYEQISSSEAVD